MVEMLAGSPVSGLRVRHLAASSSCSIAPSPSAPVGPPVLNIFDFMSEALNDVVDTNYISLHVPNLERMAGRPARRR